MDLKYFEKLLLERKEQILKNISSADSEIENLKDSEINDEIDFANICTDNMIEFAIKSQQIQELKEIEEALQKIKNGDYGICEMCGEPIKPLRLKIKPYAKYCIICREVIEKDKNVEI
ncbi:RNA polymerase-binding protein DksA [Nitratiruptor sp. YY09-18]|uniref:RNA polymerase-binding protein DksA n=1 Tax=Nitratiruptor sp. YY09-18 TaxID=2724901 RepID=UPI001915EAEA|nr:RNA polymerase-binding protein DksA [Nitratiruptor sp. YY09-18]BCD68093.1 DnaK suppressor protein [Nitratiruptor sp. YY09-18]